MSAEQTTGVRLKTIEEHNMEKWEEWQERRKPRLTGIKCPGCGTEVWRDPSAPILTSYPPQIQVDCANCGWRSSILA